MDELPIYVLERTFAAPRELVWKAWAEPALFARWYGPNVETIVHRIDLRSGGTSFVEMRWGGNSSCERMDYLEVTPPARLVWLNTNADAEGNVAANPRMPDWPRTLLTTVTLDEAGGETQFRLTWSPHEASDAEIACFAAAMDGLGKGWNAGMELLAKLLTEMQSDHKV
jgi:uncharacterized protein YndB with AHSA1/START domain